MEVNLSGRVILGRRGASCELTPTIRSLIAVEFLRFKKKTIKTENKNFNWIKVDIKRLSKGREYKNSTLPTMNA